MTLFGAYTSPFVSALERLAGAAEVAAKAYSKSVDAEIEAADARLNFARSYPPELPKGPDPRLGKRTKR